MQEPKIFFSYSRDDGDFVLKLAQDLRAEGISLWLDQLDIAGGERWDLAVEEALQSCATQIIVLSPSSVGSQNVMDEVSFALEEHKQVIPVVCRECDVPFRLRRVQRIDFAADYDQGFKKLLATLSVERESKPSEASQRADESSRKPKQAAGPKSAHTEESTANSDASSAKAGKKGKPWLKIVALAAVVGAGFYGYTMLQDMQTDPSGPVIDPAPVDPPVTEDDDDLISGDPVDQPIPDFGEPIAWYPLESDAEDATGNNSPMSLTGVQIQNGSLSSGGVYNDDTASTYPQNWNLERFAISAQFFVTDTGQDDPSDATDFGRPVFITGQRWLGYYLEKDGTVSMTYNNDQSVTSNVSYTLNEWHTATVTYVDGYASFYLDGEYAGGEYITFDFVNENPTPSIGITDYSNGRVFKGALANLTVYNIPAGSPATGPDDPISGDPLDRPMPDLGDPIAWYPLESDAEDATGNNSPMVLTGVQIQNGSLSSGGVYNDDTVSTYPQNWNLERFAISAQFYVTATGRDDPSDATDFGRPVFITGQRWLGYYLEKDGTVSMTYNNDQSVTSNVSYTLNEWHTATVTYVDGYASFYLDGEYAGGEYITFDFVNEVPTPSIGITDYSNGRVFKGALANLTVYNIP